MAIKNKSMYAILGILNLAPSTGYDIKRYSDKVLSGFWNENFGHIYPTLKKLLENEMIEVIPGESNDNKIRYGITEKGKRELDDWLVKKSEQQPMRSEFMLKLLFSSSQPTDYVIRMLREYKERHLTDVAHYLEIQEALMRDQTISKERKFFLNMTLRRGIIAGNATVTWCDEAIEEVGKGFSEDEQ